MFESGGLGFTEGAIIGVAIVVMYVAWRVSK
jgi:multisubunit Na+/H+ antiporter MnhB subunit